MHKITLSVLCMLFSATTLAGTSEIKSSNNQVSIQAISTNVNYTETGSGTLGSPTGTLDTEVGDIPGFGISISTMTGDNNQYFEAEYDHSSGNTTYTGGLTGSSPTPYGSVVGASSATLTNFSGRFGKGLVIGNDRPDLVDSFMLTPYVELGHHKWDRGINYGEVYTNDYFAIGTLWQFSSINSNLVVSANAMLGTTFRSKVVVNSGTGLIGSSYPLGNSTLYKVGLSADYAISKHVHGNVGVDYTSFGYGMSPVYPAGAGFVSWEPGSSTNYTTFKLGLGYGF